MGYKKYSKEQELQIVEEYRQGVPVEILKEKYGPCKIHRKTYAPVSKYFSKQLSLDLDFNEEENEK